MRVHLHVWRQENAKAKGRFEKYEAPDISPEMSFLEMLDVVNEKLVAHSESSARWVQPATGSQLSTVQPTSSSHIAASGVETQRSSRGSHSSSVQSTASAQSGGAPGIHPLPGASATQRSAPLQNTVSAQSSSREQRNGTQPEAAHRSPSPQSESSGVCTHVPAAHVSRVHSTPSSQGSVHTAGASRIGASAGVFDFSDEVINRCRGRFGLVLCHFSLLASN